MKTNHKIIHGDARYAPFIEPLSVDLVVTSPPYPMIQMWDDVFASMNPEIANALDKNEGVEAFELMHKELDKVWDEVFRVLKIGGIACINIGDATRKVGNDFQMFSNHSRILNKATSLGFQVLPSIIWRKPTNAPNKFMGSGMLPPGAYVTLEHETILILRKGAKREFKSNMEKKLRRKSAYFWEERNKWFSDIWTDLRGASQPLLKAGSRNRSASFPLELPYRLIQMFSIYNDTILDPFLGTGTTTLAAMISARNSVGIESERDFVDRIISRVRKATIIGKETTMGRYNEHLVFISKRKRQGTPLRHTNSNLNFPVMTSQEKDLLLFIPELMEKVSKSEFIVRYVPFEPQEHIKDHSDEQTNLSQF